MMNTLNFYFEQLDDGTYRATFDDDFVTWGYGDNPYQAVIDLLENTELEGGE